VAGSYKYNDEPSGSGATQSVIYESIKYNNNRIVTVYNLRLTDLFDALYVTFTSNHQKKI
jgi:hypothetical protein